MRTAPFFGSFAGSQAFALHGKLKKPKPFQCEPVIWLAVALSAEYRSPSNSDPYRWTETSISRPLYRRVSFVPEIRTRDRGPKCFVTDRVSLLDSGARFRCLGAVTRRSAPYANSLARSIAACERPP